MILPGVIAGVNARLVDDEDLEQYNGGVSRRGGNRARSQASQGRRGMSQGGNRCVGDELEYEIGDEDESRGGLGVEIWVHW
mmetsp:Transcript_38258/g.61345  ORF Transcript_38258/g.61345 Transcript_38258/m.61345 type:complete len:81 (-) Transcript_38258:1586-1828(-)|eukprot:CAMPEP_0198679740 /NCGR_PEP_ID=MMETSP1468-20131203/3312_1 /TAXON_ID=1461545 /ORGANISM="Mantoniella sp, Strain CCMP1436" /LENGTH=80 /DNA_ID=CAMNT_0044418859 /DNA_START=139 /DNA_END=381 /DNA_ORIENTATION=+